MHAFCKNSFDELKNLDTLYFSLKYKVIKIYTCVMLYTCTLELKKKTQLSTPILKIIIAMQQIEMLGLSGNLVAEPDVEAELLNFLSKVKTLKVLTLNYCRLRPQFGKRL